MEHRHVRLLPNRQRLGQSSLRGAHDQHIQQLAGHQGRTRRAGRRLPHGARPDHPRGGHAARHRHSGTHPLPHDGEQRRPDRSLPVAGGRLRLHARRPRPCGERAGDLHHPRRNGRGRRSRVGGLRLQRQPRQMDPVRQFAQAPSGHAHLERIARCRTLCRRGRRAPLRRDRIERGQRLARRLPDQRPESAPLAGRGLQRRACGGRDRHLHEELRRPAPLQIFQPCGPGQRVPRLARRRLLLQPVEGLLFASKNQRPRPAHVDERRRSGLPEGRNGRQRMGRDGRRQNALRRGHPPFVRAVSGRKLHVLHRRHSHADRLFRSAQGQQLYAGHGLQRHRRMGRRPFGGKAAREDHHPEMDRPLSARNGGVGRAAPHGISAVLPHAHQHQCLERA